MAVRPGGNLKFYYRMSILETLVKKGVIRKTDIAEIRKELSESGVTLEEALVKRGVNAEDILVAKGEQLGLPTARLSEKNISSEILKRVPEESAMHYRFVPIGFSNGTLEAGIVDPDNIEARAAIDRKSR